LERGLHIRLEAYFLERRKAEVQLRRITLPRTPVNKGEMKGHAYQP
jgi:hypothetical protein